MNASKEREGERERERESWRRRRSEEGLLTLAVSQAICVAVLHVLLKAGSAGYRDITVSTPSHNIMPH